jgi:hypothetical protein
MKWKWPWNRREPSQETLEARKKLQEIKKDDLKLDTITRRTKAMVSKNHLGEDIKRALGGYR